MQHFNRRWMKVLNQLRIARRVDFFVFGFDGDRLVRQCPDVSGDQFRRKLKGLQFWFIESCVGEVNASFKQTLL